MPGSDHEPDLTLARRELRSYLESLAAGDARALTRSFRTLFAGLSRLGRYSAANAALVLRSRPDATLVGGPAFWHARGRKVRKGERGVFIGAPRRSGSPWPLVPVEVFDLAQTYGPPGTLPAAATRPTLAAVEAAAARLGLEPEAPATLPGLGARPARPRKRSPRTRLFTELTPGQRVSYLVHDYALALLVPEAAEPGRPGVVPAPTGLQVAEVEAAAFVALTALALPPGSPQLGALRGLAGKDLVRVLGRVHAAAHAIVVAVRGREPRLRIPPARRAA
jgi:hypothetical protein